MHQVNYGVYGARKVWLPLNREDIPIPHCTVRRLMREQGLAGAHRGKKKRTTIADPQALRVSTWSRWARVAFVIDAYSRRIAGAPRRA